MDILMTGCYGRCGTAILDHLYEKPNYDFTLFNRTDRSADHPYGAYDTVVGNVTDREAVHEAVEGHDSIIHLAAYPYSDGSWNDVYEPNVKGMYNVLEAAADTEVESIVFASTNHVLGMYEIDNEPELYEPGHGMALDHNDPVRPDSYYGTTKAFGETLGRQFIETHEYPKQFYALRICTVKMPKYDHPYGSAEERVAVGEIERGGAVYDREVARMKAMWHSRRDFSHLVDCCLRDNSVEYGIFNGVSGNDRRWFSIEHARSVLGYVPKDNGEKWTEPPH